jgi:hypothetical protein
MLPSLYVPDAMRSMLANAHRQDLSQVEVVSELLRWEDYLPAGLTPEVDYGTQFWKRPFNSQNRPKPHLLGTRIPQPRPMVAGMLLNPSGRSITLDDRPLHGGVLRGGAFSVPSDHAYVCIHQDVTPERDFYTIPDEEPLVYLTGEFSATYTFRVLDAGTDEVMQYQDVINWQGGGTPEDPPFSCDWIIGEIYRDASGSLRLFDRAALNDEAAAEPLQMTTNPLFLPYRGFGYFGGGGTFRQVGLLLS